MHTVNLISQKKGTRQIVTEWENDNFILFNAITPQETEMYTNNIEYAPFTQMQSPLVICYCSGCIFLWRKIVSKQMQIKWISHLLVCHFSELELLEGQAKALHLQLL